MSENPNKINDGIMERQILSGWEIRALEDDCQSVELGPLSNLEGGTQCIDINMLPLDGKPQHAATSSCFPGVKNGLHDQHFCQKIATHPLLNNDIDDEEFDKYFSSQSQWQMEFESSPQVENVFNTPAHPIVPMDRMDKLFEEMVEFEKDVEIAETNAVRTPLLSHQRMALNWMIERENNIEMAPFWSRTASGFFNQATLESRNEKPLCMKGGILADDMGLGKTLVTIALILGNHTGGNPMFMKSRKRQNFVEPHQGEDCIEIDPVMKVRKSLSDKKGNDASEANDDNEVKCLKFKKKKEGYLKPHKIIGKDLKQPGFKFRQFYLKEMKKKDSLSSKPRKRAKKEKVPKERIRPKIEEHCIAFSDSDEEKDCRNLSKQVTNIMDSPSLKDFSRRKSMVPGMKNNEVNSTLIICPMSVISNWTKQFQQHVNPEVDLHLYLYYGPDRVKDIEFLKKQDIVLTTYNTLSYDFRQNKSPLHEITWLRIVLDEGHVIRNVRSSQSVSTVRLNAHRRWVLTGTPIQNRMADLWTILKFLRFEPFTDERWWKDILLLPMRNKTVYTYNRINKLMKHITIRRLKTDLVDGKPIVDLPQKNIIIEEITLEGEQKKYYDIMQNKGKLTLCRYLRQGIRYVLRNYANILVIIMRLRQLCCHPKLCEKILKDMEHAMNVRDQLEQWQQQDNASQDQGTPKTEVDDDDSGNVSVDEEKLIEQLLQVLAAGDSEECAICLENLNNAVITRCAHVFCYDCIVEVIESAQLDTLCPLCRGEISKEQLIKVPEKAPTEELIVEDEHTWESSAKVDALIQSLINIRSEDPTVKSIIVSQFTSFLNLIQIPLRRAKFRYTRIDGGMTQTSRAEAIEEFNDCSDDSPTIMLLSLNAGGVGLTLTAATRVFLMDPAWNPAAEDQCFNRCHRLGQNKDVTIVKYVVRDSIEERMLLLQERKRELMKEAFGACPQTNEQRMRGRVQELRSLIGLSSE